MKALASLLKTSGTRPRGPAPTFEGAHILLAFMTIGDSGSIGRQVLAQRSGLGEGAVRTVLKKLREDEYADADPSGCFLTPSGRLLYSNLRRKLSPMAVLGSTPMTVGQAQAALAVRGGGKAMKAGIEQRDSAIRLGASGATTYVIRERKFTVPGGSSDCEKDFPSKAWVRLRRELGPTEGDAVIISGAMEETTAKLGALAAAITLI